MFLNQINFVLFYFAFAKAGIKAATHNKSLVCGQAVNIGLHAKLDGSIFAIIVEKIRIDRAGRFNQYRTHYIS